MDHYLVTIKRGRVIIIEEWYWWDGGERLLFQLRRLPYLPDVFRLWYGPKDRRNRWGKLAKILTIHFPYRQQILEIMALSNPAPDKIRSFFPPVYRIRITSLDH